MRGFGEVGAFASRCQIALGRIEQPLLGWRIRGKESTPTKALIGGMSVATTRSPGSNEQGAKQVLGIQSYDGKACSTRWLWRRDFLLSRRQFLCTHHPAFLPGPVAALELIEAAAAVRYYLSLNLRFDAVRSPLDLPALT